MPYLKSFYNYFYASKHSVKNLEISFYSVFNFYKSNIKIFVKKIIKNQNYSIGFMSKNFVNSKIY